MRGKNFYSGGGQNAKQYCAPPKKTNSMVLVSIKKEKAQPSLLLTKKQKSQMLKQEHFLDFLKKKE
jgi:hypothetical protein